MLIVNQSADAERKEAELARLMSENARLTALVEYIGAMDYPEILEDEEGTDHD